VGTLEAFVGFLVTSISIPFWAVFVTVVACMWLGRLSTKNGR